MFKPTSPINAGFDFRIRYSLADSSERYIDTFYQVRFSEADDSSTNLTSEELIRSYEQCKDKVHPRADGFVVVFMMWRNGGREMEIPTGSLLLHPEILRETLGPKLTNFSETLTTRPISVIDR